jgi:hypothetical protein
MEPAVPTHAAGVTPWVAFQVIDHDTDAPAAGVSVRLKLPDGTVATYTTDDDGLVHLPDLPDGTCDLEQVLDGEGIEIVDFA